jgi:hypothetical protein
MQFIRAGDIYKVARITGAQDNLLGVTLSDNPGEIDLVAFAVDEKKKVGVLPDEVLRQVTEGLADVNAELGKSYYLSCIYYLPHESAANSVYKLLIGSLIRKIDAGEIG